MDQLIIEENVTSIEIEQVGSPGPKGDDGEAGISATVTLGTVEQGDTASITNTGDEHNAVFNFVLPKGDKGEKGDDGSSSTLQNVGDGVGVFKETTGSIAYLKSIKSLSNKITVVSDTDTVNINFDNTEIDNINTQIETINQAINNIDGELVGISSTINSLNDSITSINTSITNINTQVGTNTTAITAINLQITDINTAITALQNKVLPGGGTTGQVLVKNSNTDFDAGWQTLTTNAETLENTFISWGVAVSNGFTSNNNTWQSINTPSTYTNGNDDSPLPAFTAGKEKYDGRARNLYRVVDSPTSTSTTSYYSPVGTRYVGTTNYGGLGAELEFCFETNVDTLSKVFVGEISTFIGVTSISSGPSSLNNCIGFGFDSTDSIFSIYVNGTNATATKIPLSSFSGNLIASDYQARVIQSPYLVSYKVSPGGSNIIFKFVHVLSGRSGTYTLSGLTLGTQMPGKAIPLRPMFNITAGQAMARMDGIACYYYYLTKSYR